MYILVYSQGNIKASYEELTPTTVWMILWAQVRSDWQLSTVLKDRVDAAIQAYKKWIIKVFLVSGDNGSQYYNEVVPVQKYLLEQGIDKGDIYLDYAGFDTYSSMYRAREIFQVKDIIVFTNAFHLGRSLYIAEKLWIHAQWFASDKGAYVWSYWWQVRETGARIKAFVEVEIIKPFPKYLWDKIPIE